VLLVNKDLLYFCQTLPVPVGVSDAELFF